MSLKYRFRRGWFGSQILQVCHSPRPDQKTMVSGWRDANQEEADAAYIIMQRSYLRCEYDFRKNFLGKYVLFVQDNRNFIRAGDFVSRNVFLALNNK